MKYVVDLHTHTIVSGHAYTTLLENVKQASLNGIKVLGTTEHGPAMPGGANLFYFGNMRNIPRELYGVKILRGCEANIMGIEGNLDIPKKVQEKLDIIIASLHDACLSPSTKSENTTTVLNAMDNPNIDIFGHLGNPIFEIDIEEVVKKAKETNKLIEINNGSFMGSRQGSFENCIKIAEACIRHKVKVILGSDSHICFSIGKFEKAEEIFKKVNMPEELIMNTEESKIIEYLKAKGRLSDF